MKGRKSRRSRPGVHVKSMPRRAVSRGCPANTRRVRQGAPIDDSMGYDRVGPVRADSVGVLEFVPCRGLVLDNKGLLLQDPRIRAATGANMALIFEHTYWWPLGEAGIYRPLTTLSYLFNYAILGNGDQPAGYHWVNLVLHMVNVLLVFAVGRRLLGQLGPSALLAALWAVHPASTESVTNIIGRSDLLAAMATLSGFLMYVKSTQTAGPRRIAWLVGLGMVTAAGVYSKESAVTIAGVIALYELAWPGRRRWFDFCSGFVATGIPIAGDAAPARFGAGRIAARGVSLHG